MKSSKFYVYRLPKIDAEISFYQKLAKKREISLIGKFKELADNAILITDVFFLKNEGTSTTNEMDNEELNALWTEQYILDKTLPRNLFCHIHTHPGFGVTPSGTDDRLIEEELSKFDFHFSGIFNGTDQWFWQLNTFKPIRCSMICETAVLHNIAIDEEALTKTFKEKFTETVYHNNYNNSYKGQKFYETHEWDRKKGKWIKKKENKNQQLLLENEVTSSRTGDFILDFYNERGTINHNKKTKELEKLFLDKFETIWTNFVKVKPYYPKKSVVLTDRWQVANNGSLFNRFGFTEADMMDYSHYLLDGVYNNTIDKSAEHIMNDIRLARIEMTLGHFTSYYTDFVFSPELLEIVTKV